MLSSFPQGRSDRGHAETSATNPGFGDADSSGIWIGLGANPLRLLRADCL